METTRIQNGQTEQIEVLALDANGDPATGLADVYLSIRRLSDGKWLDFSDNTFKTSGWTTRQAAMAEVSASLDPGKYSYSFNTAGFVDDSYELRADCASAGNFPQIGELKVGGYVDNIDAAISGVAGGGSIVALPIMPATGYSATTQQGQSITISRGDGKRIYFDARADYTGWSVKFGAKASPEDTDYVIPVKDGGWDDASKGRGYVDLTAIDTAVVGTLAAEIELRKEGNDPSTPWAGTLKIIQDVIR